MKAQLACGRPTAIDIVADEWRAVCDSARQDEPFYRPEWIRTYLDAFAPDVETVVATMRSGGRLAAVLPLVRERGTLGGIPVRKLRSAGNTHTCRYELVRDAHLGDGALGALWEALAADAGWDVLELENIPRDGALSELGVLAARHGCATHVTPSLSPPYLDLARFAGRYDALLESLDAKFRSNLRRRRRKLEGHGRVELVASDGIDERLAQFYALERSGWKGRERSAIACDDAVRRFYDGTARAAAERGYFRLYSLEVDGRPAAMWFGLYYRRRYYLLKTAYDETLQDCSPGQLLTGEALRHLMSEGCLELDFLGTVMDWKRDWGPALRQLGDLHVCRGIAGRAAYAMRFQLRPTIARVVRRVRPA